MSLLSLAWSDIMLHIRGKLTAFSPLIPLQPSQTVFLPNQLATLIFIIRALRGGRWQLTTVSTLSQSVRIVVVVVMPRLRILSWWGLGGRIYASSSLIIDIGTG